MKENVVKKTFSFNLYSTLLYLLLMALLISLGFWQLGRSEQKQQILTKQNQSASSKRQNITTLIGLDSDSIRYRKTSLQGVYDTEHQFLIDNQIINGKPGYFVLTPFKIKAYEQAVLVNRGWVPLNKDRRILPDLAIKQINTVIKGRINAFPVVGIKLAGAEIPALGWPSVVQVVDINILGEKLAYSLLPYQIELAPEMQDGYLRLWKENTLMPPEKHIAYAVQWFGLAVTLTLLFLWYSRKESK